jgi:hypothetical protein
VRSASDSPTRRIFFASPSARSRFAEAIEKSGSDVVPKIQMTSDGKGGGSLVENLLALLLSGKLGETMSVMPTLEADPRADSLRAELRRSLNGSNGASKANGAAGT